MSEQNGWNEWSKVVLTELERLTESNKDLAEEFQNFRLEVAKEIASKKEVAIIKEELSTQKLAQQEALSTAKEDYNKKLSELESKFDSKLATLDQKHSVELATLNTDFKTKSGAYGMLGSLLGVIIAIAIAVFG